MDQFEQNRMQDEQRSAIEESQNALIVPARSQSLERAIESGQFANLNNFDGDARHKWRLSALAVGGECFGFDDVPKDGIALKYYFIHPVEIEDNQGEMHSVIRTVLIDDEDKAFAFVSDGIVRDLDMLCSFFGASTFDPPVPIRINRVKTRKGRQLYKIISAE